MTTETLQASRVISAPADVVFAALADPATHPAIDGTGWVTKALDAAPLAAPDQMFRMAMYHVNHPDGAYEMANKVVAFDPPRTISWEPGQDVAGDGKVEFGGWIWRYDLAAADPTGTEVTLTYDWSAVPPFLREHITFPPFAVDHLRNSLRHLDELVTGA